MSTKSLVIGRLAANDFAVAFCLLAIVVPSTVATVGGIIDPFSYSTAVLAGVYQKSGHISIQPFNPVDDWSFHANGFSNRMVAPILLAMISEVTSIRIGSIIFAPMLLFTYVLLTYILGFVITRSRFISFLYAAIQGGDIQLLTAINNLFYITLGDTLLVLFLTLYLLQLKDRRNENLLMMIVTFLALILTYYGTEFLALTFVFSSLLLTYGQARKTSGFRTPLYLAIMLGSIALMYESFAYSLLLIGKLNLGSGIGLLTGYVAYLFGLAGRAPGELSLYAANASPAPYSYVSELLYRLVLAISILIFLVMEAWNLAIRKPQTEPNRQRIALLFSAFIMSVALHMVVYASAGLINFRSFYMFGPLLAMISLSRMRKVLKNTSGIARKLKHAPTLLGVLLILIVLARYALFFPNTAQPYAMGGYEQVQPALRFLVQSTPKDTPSKVVSSVEVSGQLFFVARSEGNSALEVYYFSNDYQFLYNSNMSLIRDTVEAQRYDFIVISQQFRMRVVDINGWIWAPPATAAFRTLPNTPGMNVVYQDSYAFTIKTS